MTVRQLLDILNEMAAFDTAASFDNCGLLTGRGEWTVQGIHLALDCTPDVLDEMQYSGDNVLIVHHPLMFSPRQNVTEEDWEGRLLNRLIRQRIALIAMHTNLDQAPGGINDVLAHRVGLRQITGEGYIRVGELPHPMNHLALQAYLQARLGDVVRVMGQGTVRLLAVSSGAGGEGFREARQMGADGFLTGEMKHHHALEAAGMGMVCFEGGHDATERPGILHLGEALQQRLHQVQWNVPIHKTQTVPYSAGHLGREG